MQTRLNKNGSNTRCVFRKCFDVYIGIRRLRYRIEKIYQRDPVTGYRVAGTTSVWFLPTTPSRRLQIQ